jgi:hypothetical protein
MISDKKRSANPIITSCFTSPFEKRGNEGDFEVTGTASDSENLPLPLFFKEGNWFHLDSSAVKSDFSRQGVAPKQIEALTRLLTTTSNSI